MKAGAEGHGGPQAFSLLPISVKAEVAVPMLTLLLQFISYIDRYLTWKTSIVVVSQRKEPRCSSEQPCFTVRLPYFTAKIATPRPQKGASYRHQSTNQSNLILRKKSLTHAFEKELNLASFKVSLKREYCIGHSANLNVLIVSTPCWNSERNPHSHLFVPSVGIR